MGTTLIVDSRPSASASEGGFLSRPRSTGPSKRLRWIVFTLVAALAVSATGLFAFRDHLWGERAAARSAFQALEAGDLLTVGDELAANRGQRDFAYFFASEVTPREIGDALATVAGESRTEPLDGWVDTHWYELLLTDLAGTLGLATFGREDRALPDTWASDFSLAMTEPTVLYGTDDGESDEDAEWREQQDTANRSNLLLLLSRGYWSTDFLKTITRDFYNLDQRKANQAWPIADPSAQIGFAPAPNGVYLTDGILALTAALTANPVASQWAFTKFIPGSTEIAGTDYSVGKFTHFLLFEHKFEESLETGTLGMTAALTALSSAIDSAAYLTEAEPGADVVPSDQEVQLREDVATLNALVQDLTADRECTWNPLDYGHCLAIAAQAVWQWIMQWGHVVLELLTFTTFAPFPFSIIGVAAATSNATWYAIESDYASAGLSLAAAVPGLAFTTIAKAVKAGKTAEKAAANSDEIARAAALSRDAAPYVAGRMNPSMAVKNQVLDAAPKTKAGYFIDPNTGQPVPPVKGSYHVGHKPGFEWRCIESMAKRKGWTMGQLREFVNNPDLYQIEDPSSNMSRRFEAETCAI